MERNPKKLDSKFTSYRQIFETLGTERHSLGLVSKNNHSIEGRKRLYGGSNPFRSPFRKEMETLEIQPNETIQLKAEVGKNVDRTTPGGIPP